MLSKYFKPRKLAILRYYSTFCIEGDGNNMTRSIVLLPSKLIDLQWFEARRLEVHLGLQPALNYGKGLLLPNLINFSGHAVK